MRHQDSLSNPIPPVSDPNARGLERRPVQRHGKDKPLGRPVLRGPHDIRQLRPVQLVGGHSC